jgi:hypothetical protein
MDTQGALACFFMFIFFGGIISLIVCAALGYLSIHDSNETCYYVGKVLICNGNPTFKPTNKPTRPTSFPTTLPTQPTSEPSTRPSKIPTLNPTRPTNKPTTGKPSKSPSLNLRRNIYDKIDDLIFCGIDQTNETYPWKFQLIKNEKSEDLQLISTNFDLNETISFNESSSLQQTSLNSGIVYILDEDNTQLTYKSPNKEESRVVELSTDSCK